MKFGLVIISKEALNVDELNDVVAPFMTNPDEEFITSADRTAFYQSEYDSREDKEQTFFTWLEENYGTYEVVSQGDELPLDADGVIVVEDDNEVLEVYENSSISEIASFSPSVDDDFELDCEPNWQFKRGNWIGFDKGIDSLADHYYKAILNSKNSHMLNRTFDEHDALLGAVASGNHKLFKTIFQRNYTPADAVIDLRVPKKNFEDQWVFLTTSSDDVVHPTMKLLDEVDDQCFFNVLLCAI